MQQRLSRRKGDIYRYQCETRQVTIQLLWHLTCKSREAENINVWRTQKNVVCFRDTTPPPAQTHSAVVHHLSSHTYQNWRHTNIFILVYATFIYPSISLKLNCLKWTNDGHSFLWDRRKTPFPQRLSISSFSVKFKLYLSLKFPVSHRPKCYTTVECLPVAKTMHGPIKSPKHCSEGNLTLACSISYIWKLQNHGSFSSGYARKWVSILAPQLASL